MSKKIQVVLDNNTYEIMQLVAGTKDSEKARHCIMAYLDQNSFTKELRKK